MAEIPGIPFKPRKKPKRKRNTSTTIHWVARADSPLVPWMYAYAHWLAEQPAAELSRKNAPNGYRRGPPTTFQRTARASLLSKAKINVSIIQALEQRQDFIAYFEKLRSDVQFRARELMQAELANNVNARKMALNVALDLVPDPDRPGEMKPGPNADPKTVESFTRWVTDVAFPKKAASEERAPKIVINIGAGEALGLIGKALEEDEITDVDFEVVETKMLEAGDEQS